ncbi:hypothetical protein ACJX0J_013556, partial [Zea mays]
ITFLERNHFIQDECRMPYFGMFNVDILSELTPALAPSFHERIIQYIIIFIEIRAIIDKPLTTAILVDDVYMPTDSQNFLYLKKYGYYNDCLFRV